MFKKHNVKTIIARRAKHRLNKLMDEIAALNRPVKISGSAGSAVLVPQKLWDSFRETLYLCSIPEMNKSILKSLKIPVKDLSARICF